MKTTRVIFFREPMNIETVFAFFPDENFNWSGDKTSYSHVGQHSACSSYYCLECDEATQDEYKDLYEELESIGYRLEVIEWSDICDEIF